MFRAATVPELFCSLSRSYFSNFKRSQRAQVFMCIATFVPSQARRDLGSQFPWRNKADKQARTESGFSFPHTVAGHWTCVRQQDSPIATNKTVNKQVNKRVNKHTRADGRSWENKRSAVTYQYAATATERVSRRWKREIESEINPRALRALSPDLSSEESRPSCHVTRCS